ncbi:TPA: hypothetical protein ACOFEQ_002488 [Stenotrophomonas maltophilia]|nr:hypothetical protein [Stenotrophomonas maltophilia]
MSEVPSPCLPTAYPSADDAAGYMPLSVVYAALDFVVHCAGETDNPPASAAAARDFLTHWMRLGPSPSAAQVDAARQAMTGASIELIADLHRALAGFIADLDQHPSSRPGTVFGAYHAPLQELRLGQ